MAASGLSCRREVSVVVIGLSLVVAHGALGLAGSFAGHGLSCPAARGDLSSLTRY